MDDIAFAEKKARKISAVLPRYAEHRSIGSEQNSVCCSTTLSVPSFRGSCSTSVSRRSAS
jgi:hypothetical protein